MKNMERKLTLSSLDLGALRSPCTHNCQATRSRLAGTLPRPRAPGIAARLAPSASTSTRPIPPTANPRRLQSP